MLRKQARRAKDHSPPFQRWVPGAQDESSPVRDERTPRARDGVSFAPAGLRWDGSRVPTVETVGYVRSSLRDWRERRAEYSCETNPIFGRCLVGRGRRAEGDRAAPPSQEPIMRNKPNSRRSAKTPRADRAKQSQFSRQTCKTNPILPTVPGGARPKGRRTRGKCAKQSQFSRRCPVGWGRRDRGRGTNVQNEANFRWSAKAPAADCAKQSQFSRRCPVGWGRRDRGRGANVRNEPNFRRCRAGRARSGFERGTNVQNEPNLPSPGGIGGASRDPKRDSSRLGARSTLPVGAIAPMGYALD